MELCNSFQGTMKVAILHGYSSKFILRLERNGVLSNSKFELEILLVLRFSKTDAY
jgi:hypothetical protein